jgi:hypothetical protein
VSLSTLLTTISRCIPRSLHASILSVHTKRNSLVLFVLVSLSLVLMFEGKLIADAIRPFLGDNAKIVSGVTDGGELASVKWTGQQLEIVIEERLCLCHTLNNTFKRLLEDYYAHLHIAGLKAFITRINFSNPFKGIFDIELAILLMSRIVRCMLCDCFSKEEVPSTRRSYKVRPLVKLLYDYSHERWSSTARMLAKGAKFRQVIELMYLRGSADDKQYIPNWNNDDWKMLDDINGLMLPSILALDLLQGT